MGYRRTATPEQLRARLRAAGLRVTAPRLAVLQVLLAAKGPMSHAEVAERLTESVLDRTTVYRNLVDLTEAGLLRRSNVAHTFRFSLAQGHETKEPHAHFVCARCGQVACLPPRTVRITPGRGAPTALRQGALEIEVRGVCDGCR